MPSARRAPTLSLSLSTPHTRDMRRAAALLARHQVTRPPCWLAPGGGEAAACSSSRAGHARDAPRTPAIDGNDEVLGVMTPVTRKLWLARLARQAAASAGSRIGDGLHSSPSSPSQPVPIQLRTGPVPAEPTTITYPLSSSPAMRALYRNPWGAVRLGRVLEDLDSLAGSIALTHADACAPGTRPPMLVTASVDAIRLHRPLPADRDLTAVGAVVWTGKTSMDIRIEVHDEAAAAAAGGGEAGPPPPSPSSAGVAGSLLGAAPPALAATFTFACRDPDTAAPLAIPPLAPPTHPTAVGWWQERAAVAAARRAARAGGAAHPPPPPPAAAAWADALLTQARTVAALPALAPPGVLLSSSTALSNTFVCQPQQRNLAGRIFGGLIMRRAFELGYAAAYTFSGWRPHLASVDEVAFLAPVDVGDLLSLRAAVLHTATTPGGRKGHVHVVVSAHVIRPEGRSSALSNTFHFRYRVDLKGEGGGEQPDDGSGQPTSLRTVLPSTPEEARLVAAHYKGGGRV